MKNAAAVVVCICALSVGLVMAQGPKPFSGTAEEFEAKLGFQTGNVTLSGGIATIRVPKTLRFIGEEGSRRLLTEAWGNPPGSAEGVLGMLVPADVSPLADDSWGVVISFEEEGYVNDNDAESIDYAKLLQQMREGESENNEQRKKQGYPAVSLVGWAEQPRYDKAAHKLYWAKELAFSDVATHTLNYNIRILGRRGVLVLNAVSSIEQLDDIKQGAPDVIAAVDFNEGHKYSDYLPGEKTATYGLTGLIVGAVAAKAGFFKLLWLGILAFKKLIIVGLVGAAGLIKKIFGGKPQETPDLPPPIS